MNIEVPDDILKKAGLSERDCVLELALHLYGDRRISLGNALRLSGLKRAAFEEALARHNIALYSLADLRADVGTLKDLGRL